MFLIIVCLLHFFLKRTVNTINVRPIFKIYWIDCLYNCNSLFIHLPLNVYSNDVRCLESIDMNNSLYQENE